MNPRPYRRFAANRLFIVLLATVSVIGLTSTAGAHPNHGIGSSGAMQTGLLHPWTGLDHLLAMIVVGVLAAQSSRRSLWRLPLVFWSAMAASTAVGFVLGPDASLNLGVAIFVTVFGLSVALRRPESEALVTVLVSVAGAVHGFLHGAAAASEFGSGTGVGTYLAGVLVGTATLHLTGLAMGLAASRAQVPSHLLRITGALTALAGLGVLIEMF